MFGYSDATGTSGTIRVLLADDHANFGEVLGIILDLEAGIEVVGRALDGAEAVELALALRPDVILMDVRMPDMDGIEATRRICRELPSTRVLMLSSFAEPDDVRRAGEAGAVGYLTKDRTTGDLVRAIVAAAAPRSSFPARLAAVASPAFPPLVA